MLVSDVDSAKVLDAWLGRTHASVVRIGPVAGWWGPVDHHLGCLAHLLGHHEEAERRLRHAFDIERSMGARPFAARTLAHLAVVVAARSNEAAKTLAHGARTEADAVDAEGVVSEVISILDGMP
jgi:hypothetical protein